MALLIAEWRSIAVRRSSLMFVGRLLSEPSKTQLYPRRRRSNFAVMRDVNVVNLSPVTITSLPVELLVRIVRMLPVRQRFGVLLSCKWMQDVIRSNFIGFRITTMKLRHLRTLSSGSRAEDEFVLWKSMNDLFWSRYGQLV